LATCVLAVPVAAGAQRPRRGDQAARLKGPGFSAKRIARRALGRAAQVTPTTWDHDPAVEARVDAIVAQMTTAEKADLATGQLNNFYGFYNRPQHWVTPAGRVPVYVGASSEDVELAGTITVR
jgi:beta-glucosidase